MSIFGNIVSAIFGHHEAQAAEQPATPAAGTTMAAPPAASAGPSAATAPTASAPTAKTAAPTATGQPGKMPPVDVAAVLQKLAAKSKEKLDWRKSIVDLLKLLDLDSSVKARKELADELHYPGDKKDTTAMNIWLHKQVMTKLAENGGVVPKELQH